MQYTLREGEELDRALRKFRRKVQRAGIFRDIKKHRFYEKPSEARRRAARSTRAHDEGAMHAQYLRRANTCADRCRCGAVRCWLRCGCWR